MELTSLVRKKKEKNKQKKKKKEKTEKCLTIEYTRRTRNLVNLAIEPTCPWKYATRTYLFCLSADLIET